MTAQHYLQG